MAAWSDDIGDGELVPRTIMDEPIVLYRKADGNVAAIEDRCAHRFAPLIMGKIVGGDRIQCPYHGLEFDGSGACVRNPHGTKNIPPRARVKSYPVIEKHKAVWIWMGDAPADEGKVPDFGVLDNVPELHTTKRDSIVIKANYQLIIDNLLDLSHTSYLHEGILGNADTVEFGDHGRAGRRRRGGRTPRHQFGAARHVRAVLAGPSAARRQVHQDALDGAVDAAAVHRHLQDGRGARHRHRLSRHPSADAGERALDALFFHRRALGRADDRRQAQPRSAERRSPRCAASLSRSRTRR